MPLVKKIYETDLLNDIESGIKSGLDSKLSNALQDKIESAKFQEKLRIKLDGSSEWNGEETDAEDINRALENIRTRCEDLFAKLPDSALGETTEIKVREISANEWANALSSSVITWLNDEVVPAFSEVAAKVYSDVFSDTLSKVIAERTDEFLKTASLVVVLPPGTLTIGAGIASMPNPTPIELTLDPLFTLPDSIMTTALKVPSGGGLN